MSLPGAPVAADAPLGFACRGCGQHCCVSQDVFLTPPEAARLIWFLRRRPALERRLQDAGVAWAEIFVGASTGLPHARLAFLPVDPARPERGDYCPFLAPVRAPGGPALMHWCGVHSARPAACRLFPVGRVTAGELSGPSRSSFLLLARCPGFEAPGPADVVPPGYAPPAPSQTVADWAAAQADPEQDGEREIYLREVAAALVEAGLHAAGETTGPGRLTDDQALALGHNLLFRPPAPPADPADDHAAILAWLRGIPAQIPALLSSLSPARPTGGSSA